MYHIRALQTAIRELERLDKPIARRIAERINWLAANLDDIRPEPYKGDLAGLYKFRIGDYRVVYEILYDQDFRLGLEKRQISAKIPSKTAHFEAKSIVKRKS